MMYIPFWVTFPKYKMTC